MRYGSPSTEDAIRRLKGRGINDLLIIPLYPHYAMSSYETAVAKAQEVIEQIAPEMRYTVQAPYYNDPDYIDALADRIGTPSLVVCLDSGCGNYEQLWATTSLRGMAVGELVVEGLREGVHSGDAGGVVPSSFRARRRHDQGRSSAPAPRTHPPAATHPR